MKPELQARGIRFDQVDGDLLIHEVGHYLTTLQERFMPHGLHVFVSGGPGGLTHVGIDAGDVGLPIQLGERTWFRLPSGKRKPSWRRCRSCGAGTGQRSGANAGSVDTGSFHALDAFAHAKLGYKPVEAGDPRPQSIPRHARGRRGDCLVGVGGWCVTRATVAFGLDMLGVVPTGTAVASRTLKRSSSKARGSAGPDVCRLWSVPRFVQSFDRMARPAGLVALEGAYETLVEKHPELREALDATLGPWGQSPCGGGRGRWLELLTKPGGRALGRNHVKTVDVGHDATSAGIEAAARVFGDARDP